jgi:peptidoglycan hydrolase-like protein with peptidoglycan-binding domain
MTVNKLGGSVSVVRPQAAESTPETRNAETTAALLRQPDAAEQAALLRQLGVGGNGAGARLPAAGSLDYSQLVGSDDNSRLGIGEAGPVDPAQHAALVASQRAVVDAGVALHALESGENIEALAQRFDSSVEELETLNPGLAKLLQSTVGEALKDKLVAVPVGASDVSGAPPQGITPQSGAGAYGTPSPALDQIRSGAATMHRGMGGPSVMDVQRMLNAQGANPPLAVDGKFGPKTEAALKAFQSANGVQQTGVLGQQTLSRFDNNPKRIPEPAPGTTTGGAENVSGQQLQGTAFGNQIAAAAEREARRLNSVGRCALGVNNALVSLGVPGRGHAYQKAEQLANNPRFREVNMSAAELRNLPPGAVVVWGRSDAKPYGHVSVALGGGREASDHIQSQITGGRYGTDFGNGPDPQGRQFRVFMPA